MVTWIIQKNELIGRKIISVDGDSDSFSVRKGSTISDMIRLSRHKCTDRTIDFSCFKLAEECVPLFLLDIHFLYTLLVPPGIGKRIMGFKSLSSVKWLERGVARGCSMPLESSAFC